MAYFQFEAEVPSRTAQTGTHWHTGLLRHHDHLVLPDPPRISRETSVWKQDTATLPPVAVGAMGVTIVLKGILWFGCIRVKTTQVQALAQDCKTDVIFNTLSLIFPAVGHAANIWWLDPLGAGLLSVFVVYDWGKTCFDNVSRLTGITVGDRLLDKLTFLAWRFSPLVQGYKSITAYHAGDGVWVEVDILLNEKTPLEHSHDVAETLNIAWRAYRRWIEHSSLVIMLHRDPRDMQLSVFDLLVRGFSD